MRRLAKILATGFGSGYSPLAPGTAGAFLMAILIGFWADWGQITLYTEWTQVVIMAGISLIILWIGVWASRLLANEWGEDPPQIVIDEMLGICISLIAVPLNWITIAIAFVLFRLFDIWKPLGIRKTERIGKGWGVMMDDLLAGIYANIVLHLILWSQII